ncbi:hypothetical protein [Paludibaculum fermentans]|uniref:hypothetical protein n=1 Tax=Paludibaculum fermentans TaxID=1473598 RepID=UPI003EC0AE42
MRAVFNVLAGVAIVLVTSFAQPAEQKRLIAQTFNSGFDLAHDTYNAISTGSDGRIYYVLSSESIDVGAKMFVFDPATKKIELLGDITEASGEKGKQAIAQGKSHVNFVESEGKLYFATHVGYYSIVDGMEKMGIPPSGYKPYPGGHLLAYDMKTRKFEDLAIEPHGEGIITMNMDPVRQRIYGISWPTGYFFRYDVKKRDWKHLGPVANKGENGKDKEYQTICRSLAIDPRDGSVYFSNSLGDISRYRYDTDTLEKVTGDDLRKDYFGLYDPHSAGHMGYNWRQTAWHAGTQMMYGVHGNSGYLFRFDPKASRIDVLSRITSQPSQLSGMFDQFSYGYLGFALGPDGRTLHYLTGGPVYESGLRVKGKDSSAKGESKGIENLHLITWDIEISRYTDHGPIFFSNGDRPAYVNSMAVGKDGTVYALTRVTENGRTRADLMAIPAPGKPRK